jgi:hypothetical protein
MAEASEDKAPPGMFLLKVSGDGRTSENWVEYSVMVLGVFAGKTVGDIPLEDVLLNRDDGKQLPDPGPSALAWIDRAPVPGDPAERSAATYTDRVKAYKAWKRANAQAHVLVMTSCPAPLRPACAQRLIAHELWAYLTDRFSGETLTSVAALYTRLMTL